MTATNRDYVILALGVLAVSTAAVLIREAEAAVLVIAAYRLLFASLPLLAFAGVRRTALIPSRRHDFALMLAAGVFLALHFGFWIASVKETSIVTSVVLVTAQPLFVAIASGPLLGERPSARVWGGIVLASAGGLIMVADDLGRGAGTLRGDLFAILGAIFAAAYILTGRGLRTSGNAWLPYVTVVYSTSALCLVVAAAAAGDSFTGFGLKTLGLLLLLALIPQLIGHSALNRSLGYLPAATVAVAVLGEPIGATILGILVLGDTPTSLQFIGALFVLAGVLAGSIATRPVATVEM